jgi:subtilisin family serine protease
LNFISNKKLIIIIILPIFLCSKVTLLESLALTTNFDETDNNNLWFFDAISFDPDSSILPKINTSIKIAIIDSGFNESLSSLKNNVWINENEIEGNGLDDDGNGYIDDYNGFDFVLNASISSTAESYTNHATFIAHQLGGKKTEIDAIPGVLPNVSLVNIRILDDKNSINELNWDIITNALKYAKKVESDIVLLSTEFRKDPPETVKRAFLEIQEAQIPLVTIAGNSRGEINSFPALLDWTITVGAIEMINDNFSYNHADYSNIGKSVDLVGPGTDITSYNIKGKLINMTGTSFAAPYVAGTVAWMKIINKSLSNNQIKNILVNTATNTGDCYSNGAGILNFTQTILVVQGKLPLPENQEANKTLCEIDQNNSFMFISANMTFLDISSVLVMILLFKKRRRFYSY